MPSEAQVYLQHVYCCYYFLLRQAERLWPERKDWHRVDDALGALHKDLREALERFTVAKGAFEEEETREAQRAYMDLDDATLAKLAVRSPGLRTFGPLGSVEQSLRGPVDVLGRTAFKGRDQHVVQIYNQLRRLSRKAR